MNRPTAGVVVALAVAAAAALGYWAGQRGPSTPTTASAPGQAEPGGPGPGAGAAEGGHRGAGGRPRRTLLKRPREALSFLKEMKTLTRTNEKP